MLKNYLSLIKFSHTIFALPFAMIGFFIALKVNQLEFQWDLFLKVILCMIIARSAAMSFNRYIDRDFDKLNPRTAIREIPSGIITENSALFFVIVSSLFFVLTTWFINPLCFYLSPVALIVVLGYSYTKRFTSLCHLILGVGLSLAPIGSYIAVAGRFDLLPILFSFTVLFWVGGFDIIYAMQDVDFDSSHKLNSIPVRLGKEMALELSVYLHLLSFFFILIAGMWGHFGWLYWIGTVIFGFLLNFQHSLVKPNDLSKVDVAFFTTNGVASVVFAVFVLADLFF